MRSSPAASASPSGSQRTLPSESALTPDLVWPSLSVSARTQPLCSPAVMLVRPHLCKRVHCQPFFHCLPFDVCLHLERGQGLHRLVPHDVVLGLVGGDLPQAAGRAGLAQLAQDVGGLVPQQHGVGLQRQRPEQELGRRGG